MIAKLQYGVKIILGLDFPNLKIVARPDDTFIVSHPKSGNTWTRFLVANLIERGTPVALPDMDRLVPHADGKSRRFFGRMPSPRIISTHGAFNPQMKKVISIVRDPRDVVVSLHHFHRKRTRIADDFPMEEFVSRFVAGETTPDFGSWAENVTSWIATRQGRPNFLLLRYEDLLADTPRELAKIAALLGLQVTREELVAISPGTTEVEVRPSRP